MLGCDSGSGGSAGAGGSGGSGGTGGSSGGVLRILVTNDDGLAAPGIDALVQALTADPDNAVIVVAPDGNRSGSADSTIATNPSRCGNGDVTPSATASGYDEDVWAMDGCPADCVIYGLDTLYPDSPPHVVLSGINDSQNVGNVGGALSQTSGTVGGAKTSACLGVPAMASSQGEGDTIDFDSGVTEVLSWLADNRAALLAGDAPLENITSINIPSCDTGQIRGRVEVPLATTNPDEYNLLGHQDCESTLEDPQDDLEAFFNGYVAVTPVPRNSSMTCDKLAN